MPTILFKHEEISLVSRKISTLPCATVESFLIFFTQQSLIFFIGIQGENFFLLAVAPRWGQPVYTYWRACRDSVWTEKVFAMKHNDWCVPNSIDPSAWWEWRKRKRSMKKTRFSWHKLNIYPTAAVTSSTRVPSSYHRCTISLFHYSSHPCRLSSITIILKWRVDAVHEYLWFSEFLFVLKKKRTVIFTISETRRNM